MAHNLADLNGAVMMAYQGETPWHKLGSVLPANADVPAAMAAASLNWTVEARPIFTNHGDAQGQTQRVIDTRSALIRVEDGQFLSDVGRDYRIVQNTEAFETLQPACESMGVDIVTAGAIDQGRRVWMLARMPESVEVTPGDTVNGYFLVTTGHDGATSFTARPTPVRVVCQNTLNIAMGSGRDLIRIRHSASATDKVKEAARIVSAMVKSLRTTGETFRDLANRRMTTQEIAAYISELLPADKETNLVSDTTKQRRRDIGALVWAGNGAELAGADANGATAWAAYNAVTEYFDHVRPAQAKSQSGQTAANVSAVFGANHTVKARAFEMARKLVAA